jgi:peptidoglycan/xylan/chitin deacetylase (PgdA/CDA1 family)
MASGMFRRPVLIRTPTPLISFTFDDFPESAFVMGGAILNAHGAAGTYYVSLGLLGSDEPSGHIAGSTHLINLLKNGHELGCHTFSHCHSWNTDATAFERSVLDNRRVLADLIPGAEFKSFSYPISAPRPMTKRKVSKHFMSCRGGGQTPNIGSADLNQLSAYFLEKSRDRIQEVRDVINQNREARGWLIFATHDVSRNPSPFGCTPEFFEEIVQYAVCSGARILPVTNALQEIRLLA